MIVLKFILWIVAISGVVGIVAQINDLVKPAKNHEPYGPYEKYIKRGLDAFLSTGALIVLSPILIIVAIFVRIKLGSPVLFTQDRPGKNEQIFKLIKFRSMTDQRDADGNLLPDDERLTRFGRILRSTSLDELPELINIIKGDMAVVGPRPLRVHYLPWYSEEQSKRHTVRPGLTGYAQAHGRNALSWDDKFAMDIQYANYITYKGDFRIVLDTVKTVLKHEGINSETAATMESFVDYCKAQGRKPRT